ncbi:MAG: hypothetical protein J2P17_26795, partial [Mycobacterium sp.]|nr:hypothetical protein [Mycobacterium sp.]
MFSTLRHPGALGTSMLVDIGQRLGHREIGARLDRRLGPAWYVDADLDRKRRVQRQRPHRVAQPAFGQYGRVDAADQRTQF